MRRGGLRTVFARRGSGPPQKILTALGRPVSCPNTTGDGKQNKPHTQTKKSRQRREIIITEYTTMDFFLTALFHHQEFYDTP